MEKLMNGYITTYNDKMYIFEVVWLSMTVSKHIIYRPSTFFKRFIIIG